ncbi:hypothetical protein UB46_09505 [Burkholderiaceae bacterium 16]|nr:hypothetical protein UB46_09505 [Burkholderiaceae bacterium 16]
MHTHSDEEWIQRIAEELDAPLEAVRQVYLEALRDLSTDARIHDYLRLFVVKRVTAALRRRPQA